MEMKNVTFDDLLALVARAVLNKNGKYSQGAMFRVFAKHGGNCLKNISAENYDTLAADLREQFGD